jgi:hypothetical protein
MGEFRCTYAGIGSRDISLGEHIDIANISKLLAKMNFLLFSGNAPGSDIAFQRGSGGKCVVYVPWDGFEINTFNYKTESRKHFVMGRSEQGLASILKYHPNPAALSTGGKALMARNYHQIHGVPPEFPRASFVVCCATPKGNGVEGGTNQAVSIANDLKIPVVNIRKDGWRVDLKAACDKALKNTR